MSDIEIHFARYDDVYTVRPAFGHLIDRSFESAHDMKVTEAEWRSSAAGDVIGRQLTNCVGCNCAQGRSRRQCQLFPYSSLRIELMREQYEPWIDRLWALSTNLINGSTTERKCQDRFAECKSPMSEPMRFER